MMGEETEKLIEQVRKFVYLYDTSHKLYKNVVKKVEAWNVIAEELGTTSDAAKKKWKRLRDNYMRYKESVKCVTGQAKKYQKWQWSKKMQFLDDTLRTRTTDSNIPSDGIEESTFLDNETTEHQKEAEEHEAEILPRSTQMPMLLPPLAKIKKVGLEAQHDTPPNTPVDKVLQYLQSKATRREFDGIDHLFLSYADTFRKFQPATQALMKMELATLFAKMEIKELGTPMHSLGISTSHPPMLYDHSPSPSGHITSPTPVYHNMGPMGSSTNDSYESARHLYENCESNCQSD